MNQFFFGLAIGSFVGGAIFSWLIISFLSRRGVKINFWLLRYKMIGYLRQYRKITAEENGAPGKLFYGYVVSMGLGVLFLLLGAVFAETPLF